MTDLTKFDEVRAEIAKYKEVNESIVFDYEDPQGNKDARSHVFKLRKTKSKITEVHRIVKSEALAACQAVDAEKRYLIGEVEGMIDVHATPIKAIEDRVAHESFLRAEEVRKAREAEEENKRKEIEEREAVVARKEAEIKAKEDAVKATQEKARLDAERVERETFIAEQAAENARKTAETKAAAEKKAVEDAATKAIADAKAKARAEEVARLAKVAAEKAEQTRLAELERIRIEDTKHREKVEGNAVISLNEILCDITASNKVVNAIRDGKINNVTINY